MREARDVLPMDEQTPALPREVIIAGVLLHAHTHRYTNTSTLAHTHTLALTYIHTNTHIRGCAFFHISALFRGNQSLVESHEVKQKESTNTHINGNGDNSEHYCNNNIHFSPQTEQARFISYVSM